MRAPILLALMPLLPAILAAAPSPAPEIAKPATPKAGQKATPQKLPAAKTPDHKTHDQRAPGEKPGDAKPAANNPAATGEDAPQPVTLAVAPGPVRDAARKWLMQPYAQATATELGDAGWDGTLDSLRKIQAVHQADLVLVDGHTLAEGCRAQLFDRIDWSALGRERFLPAATTDCGAGAFVSATLLAWDSDKLAGAPGWQDFWDVAKHPGRRGLRRAARGNLEIALLADGVAPRGVYATLRSADGVDRAFRKLDQLKPYIEWWDQPAQAAQSLGSAKVLLTSAPAESVHAGGKTHVGTQWAGSLSEITSWARLVEAPHAKGAAAALLVASDTARQAQFARATALGPAIRGAFALLPPDARPQNPASPANQQAALAIDEGFWLDNADKLETRFAAWLAK